MTGGTLAADRDGEGQVVVLLHALAVDRRMWDPQWSLLRQRFDVVRLDLRGYGESGTPVRRTHVEDLIEVLDHLEVPRAHLVGLSLGANVAMAAALAHPDRVGHLVLASPGLPGIPFPGLRPPDELMEVARAEGRDAAKAYFIGHRVLEPTNRDPRTARSLSAMIFESPVPQWGDGPRTPPLPPVADQLGNLTAPTLVVSGQLDIEGYRITAEEVARRIPTAELMRMPGAGHMCSMDRPSVFTEAVSSFLTRARFTPASD
ncbi:alpha/beta fold hydrolase [Rhodococcus pyridinivorans]|uniref:alpha/beta fold hydrolase n=1 Tax=Rhodococcus pyridinivorans TaxID=103816 RepID=UPI00207860F7|nr:alpha/beta fold hydrolase [Rhodococcus pyridinivorans]USI92993.1 alpha/beta hydrolase [Rhodococcus pyridinivorans]